MCDGASAGNGGACGIGVVVKNAETGDNIETCSEAIGEGTSNFAEYMAMLKSLDFVLKYHKESGVSDFLILSDSELIVKQTSGEFKVKNKNLKPFAMEVREKLAELVGLGVKFKIDHIMRDYNSEADELAKKASRDAREKDINKDYPFLKKNR